MDWTAQDLRHIITKLDDIDRKIDIIVALTQADKLKPRTAAHWSELPNEYMDDIDRYLDKVTTDRGPRYQTAKEISDGSHIPPSNRMTRCVRSYLIDQVKLPVEEYGPRTLFRIW